MQLSVIIAHRNEPDRLVKTIKSIRETSPLAEVEIVVVDDASLCGSVPDGASVLQDASTKQNIKFFSTPKRHGHAWCRNFGASHADGEWLLLTDAHMIFEPRWFEHFKAHAEASDGKTLFCGPFIASRAEIERAGNEPPIYWGAKHFFWEHGHGWDLMGIEPLPEPACPVGLSSWEVPAVIGANYFLRKEWFDRIGGLHCFHGWSIDEWPLSVKTWLCGGQVRLMPNVRLRHVLHKSGIGPNGYGKEMDQGELLFNKLSAAIQVLSPGVYNKFVAGLPMSKKSPVLGKAFSMLAEYSERLHFWHQHMRGVMVYDHDWLCDRFDLNHPEDIGAEL